MVDRIFDQDPELGAAAEALRRQHAAGPKLNGGVAEDLRLTPEQWEKINELRAMSPIERDQKIKVTAEELDCNVSTIRRILRLLQHDNGAGAAAKPGAGQTLNIPKIALWPTAVDGASLLDEIAATVRRFVVTREGVPDAVALWVLHTHALDTAFITPRLAVTSPERRCGKTTLLILLSALVARPLSTANITAAALFRVVDMVHPTLLVDEADSFLAGNEELRGIINSGHCRANSTVLRTIELREGHEVREFDVWGAVAIAAIGKLPTTIEDCSIKAGLHRRRRDEEVERLRLDRLDEFGPLARRCARWAADRVARLHRADPLVPSELHDCAADNWRPLLAIADLAGGDWPRRARKAAEALSEASFDDAESRREMLFADLKVMFDRSQYPVLSSEEVLAGLHAMDERPWSEYRGGKSITSHQLSALLRPLRVRPNSVRRGDWGTTKKGYRREDLEDAFARYLASPTK